MKIKFDWRYGSSTNIYSVGQNQIEICVNVCNKNRNKRKEKNKNRIT